VEIGYRLNRLFNARSGRCLNVAVDHGLFGEPAFLAGIEDLPSTVAGLVDARPDAIQLTPAQAPLLQRVVGREKPALVVRTDVANVYGHPRDSYLFSRHFPDAVEQAVRLDAACVVANLLQLPDRPDVRERCIEAIMDLRVACAKYAMPLMVEPLAMRDEPGGGGYDVDGDPDTIVALVRQARELGADVIKADPTTPITEFHRVVQAGGGAPVLARGGGKIDDGELLRRTESLLEQGAAGVVYGRNIIQHRSPGSIIAALMAMLHDGQPLSVALELARA
jgi:DhnA family fructose-bisphosphate aldolase class Ia